MSLGTGIALAAMWAAIGAIGWQSPVIGVVVAAFAMIATLGTAGKS